MLHADYKYHILKFITPGGTSRGILKTKTSYFIRVSDKKNPQRIGVGECSIIPKLSIDDVEHLENKIKDVCNNINYYIYNINELNSFPAIQFALETAILDLQNGGNRIIYNNDFSKGKSSVKINGLIWMGDIDFMMKQIDEKISNGFSCIKLKIGAINFKDELNLLSTIRNNFNSSKIELRVDANGAFSTNDALNKLEQLSSLDIHSIEQPIKAGQWDAMADLCKKTPLPIALDEELIGIKGKMRNKLIETIQPQYIILKPSLIGGLNAADEWIDIARQKNIGWWATSALESNIGLNAIAQWVSNKDINMPQGLGTGKVFSNNIDSPLEIKSEFLKYNINKKWTEI